MPRIRSIKPEIWNSPDFIALDGCGQLAFIALMTMADDEGRVRTDPTHMRMVALRAFSTRAIEAQLDHMSDLGMIARYRVEGRSYVALLNWTEHQKVDHPKPSTFPPPDDPRAIREDSRTIANDRESSIPRARPRTGSDRTGPEGIRPDRSGPEPPQPPAGESVGLLVADDLRGEVLAPYQAWVAELNRACGRHFLDKDPKAQKRYAELRRNGWSESDLLAVARGAAISPHHRGENNRHTPYQDPLTILGSKQIETLRDLGYGELSTDPASQEWDAAIQLYQEAL